MTDKSGSEESENLSSLFSSNRTLRLIFDENYIVCDKKSDSDSCDFVIFVFGKPKTT